MLIFNVGPDELSVDELENVPKDDYVWLVYWYKYDCYEGSGEVVALHKDGHLEYGNLGHCSCYGPMDCFPLTDSMSIEDFLKPKENIHDTDFSEIVKAKVKSLIGD